MEGIFITITGILVAVTFSLGASLLLERLFSFLPGKSSRQTDNEARGCLERALL